MAPRNSQEQQDAITWQTVGLPLGLAGLDLRQPSDPRSLKKLLNARFPNEKLTGRRNGYVGVRVQDASSFSQSLDDDDNMISLPMAGVEWVYGHGQLLVQGASTRQTYHFPIPQQNKGAFELNGTPVIWTGDRLLVVRDDHYQALGSSAFWNLDNETTPLAYGIPAYLPVQLDTPVPAAIDGDYIETCLTRTVRVTAGVVDGALTAWVIDRDTDTILNESDLGGDDDAAEIRVFESGAYVVCLWRDTVTNKLYINYWTGFEWNGASQISTGVDAYDVALVSGGFHLLRREGADLILGRYNGKTTSSTPYSFNTTLTVSDVPDGAVAVATGPDDSVCVVWSGVNGLNAKVYNASLTSDTENQISSVIGWDAGLTVCCRKLTPSIATNLKYPYVVHAGTTGDPDGTVVRIWEFRDPLAVIRSDERWNSKVATKSFRVGEEVFCWLRSINSQTLYLVAGAFMPQVSGIADREEAADRTWLSQVTQDPLDEHQWTWARPYDTGNIFTHAGNARVGDMNFLPTLSVAQYGKSCYLSGSFVRNWDGFELGDAGFHDYPIINATTQDTTGGSLTATGTYQVRVYPIRYNKQGERFMGPAVTYSTTLTGSNNRIGWQIPTIPVTNHDDILFEVYRTEAGGTTFYLDGYIANDLTTPSVTYYSTMSDSTLASTRPGDSHETGVAGSDELEELGPLGCSILAASEDRLWGAGGQVPSGWVQFSKLKEFGEGAGFDAIAGYQEINILGGPITSIIGYGDSTIVFERDRFSVIHGEGENNYGSGGFGTPELHLVDGAINHAGTGEVQAGIVYWGVDGPRLMLPNFRVEPICDPVRDLTKQLTPSGVQIDRSRQEVVWFTESGKAVLWNYQSGNRWAEWSGLKIAAATPNYLATTDGRVLTESEDAYGDDGVPFEFAGASSEIALAQLYGGDTKLGYVGVVGKYLGEHKLRVKVYYNGSPLWSDRWEWEPENNTGLQTGADFASLTPAQIDALQLRSKNGSYATHKKVNRHDCRHFRVEWSDISAERPTYQLHEISLEVGVRGGLGRVPVNSFGS